MQGELCHDYLRLKQNRDLLQVKTVFSPEIQQVVYERMVCAGNALQQCDNDDDNHNDSCDDQKYTALMKTQCGDIFVSMEKIFRKI